MSKYLALDFGAESGRLILGSISDSKIELQEIHRFPNFQVQVLDQIHWDLLFLFKEVQNGFKRAASMGHKQVSGIGVDTWGVDFGFVGRNNTILGNPNTYRDSRTNGMFELAYKKIPKNKLYQTTGIQFLPFNSIYQLLSMVETNHPLLDVAEKLLFMPDLFNFLMTGKVCTEYTIASTSQLLDVHSKTWATNVFEALRLPIGIMPEIVEPKTVVGQLKPEICSQTGLESTDVIAIGSHDTASAVAAVPAQGKNWAYLSSGTWSLLGVEVDKPIVNHLSLANNFTNEGGVNGSIRFLRNIMGMWLFERCRSTWREKDGVLGYDALIKMASQSTPFKCVINPDDETLLNPLDMPHAIAEICKKTGQPVPETYGEFVRCIFESLALKYRFVMDMINSMLSEPIERLHIVGGGSQNKMLNQFIANALNITVIAGPKEGTALGNIMLQAIAKGELNSVEEGRELISSSFSLEEYLPQDENEWEGQYQKVKSMYN